MAHPNLFHAVPRNLPGEFTEVLAEGSGTLRIERIVSRGHSSPPGRWFDQDTAEWVVLLRGAATLRFEGGAGADDRPETIAMRPGDWIEIPPHRRHRVEATSPHEDTVWLAVHWG